MKRMLLLLPVLLLFIGCEKVYRYTTNEFYSMSTFVSVISENDGDADKVEEIFDGCEDSFSRTRSGGDIYKLNSGGCEGVSQETQKLLEESIRIAEDTGYAFNPCLGTITELWDITSGKEYVPTDEEISSALEKCKVENLSFSDGCVMLENGTKIDLGGVAKGYALQKAMESIDTQNMCISLGGNVAVNGSSQYNRSKGQKGWKIGITNPFKKTDIVGNITLDNGFVSVSGSYERYFEKDGEIYHHIFDGKTGKPAESDLASVVVVSMSGLEADALSTALFVMGKDKAIEFYKSGKYKFDMILVTQGGELFITNDLMKTFEMSDEAYDNNGKKMIIIKI